MEPRKVVETVSVKHEYNLWEFNEIVFIRGVNDQYTWGVLREKWDNMFDGLVYQVVDKLYAEDPTYFLASPEYLEHYKTLAHLMYDKTFPMFSPGIIEYWEDGKRENIVLNSWLYDGFLYDLNGDAVPRLIWGKLYDNDYDILECIKFINKNGDLFDSYKLKNTPYWSNASQALEVFYKPTDDFVELARKKKFIEQHYTDKYFGEFYRE
jgi:hypothetical protein